MIDHMLNAHLGRAEQLRDHAQFAARAKDQQTRDNAIRILADAIRQGVAVSPDSFPQFDPQAAAVLLADWLGL